MRKFLLITLIAFSMIGCSNKEVDNLNGMESSIEDEADDTIKVENETEAESEIETEGKKLRPNYDPNYDIEGDAFGVGSWGDSADEIKSKENPDNLHDEQNFGIIYSTTINGIDGYVYYFTDNDYGLYKGGVQFSDYAKSASQYIMAYDDFKVLLTDKYGTPLSDVVDRADNIPETMNESEILNAGWSIYITQWETENKTIDLLMYKQDYTISIWILYEDKIYDGEGYKGDSTGL